MRDDGFYLRHIVGCISLIEQYTSGGGEPFAASTLIQDAVLRNLHILAESSQRLSNNIKGAHPEIEWRQLAAFRNILVHNYLGLHIDQVWETVQRELPVLKAQMSAILAELGHNS